MEEAEKKLNSPQPKKVASPPKKNDIVNGHADAMDKVETKVTQNDDDDGSMNSGK